MLKRSLLFAGVAAASLLGAAESAPAAASGNAGPVVTEEETVTIVAVPCSVAPANCGAGKTKECADKTKACADKMKECADKTKECADKKGCADRKAGGGTPACDYSDSDYDLAFCLMEEGGYPQGIADANSFIIAEQLDQMPMLKPARPALEKFFDRHCSYRAMKRDLARIHLETFTRDEMKKLIDFFKSPVGRKYAKHQGDIARSTLALRARNLHRNLPELQKEIHDVMTAERNSACGAAPAAQPQTAQK